MIDINYYVRPNNHIHLAKKSIEIFVPAACPGDSFSGWV